MIAVHRRARRVDDALRRRRPSRRHSTLRNASTLCWCVAIGSLIERGTEPSAAWWRTMSTSLTRLGATSGSRRSPSMNRNCSRSSGLIAQDVVEVALVAGEEVVDADDGLPEIEQPLEQRRADEARDAGHQPPARRVDQILADLVVAGARHSQAPEPDPARRLRPRSALLTSITTPPSRTRAKMRVGFAEVVLVRDREDQRVELAGTSRAR